MREGDGREKERGREGEGGERETRKRGRGKGGGERGEGKGREKGEGGERREGVKKQGIEVESLSLLSICTSVRHGQHLPFLASRLHFLCGSIQHLHGGENCLRHRW